MARKLPKLVMTCTPQRISFAGGGTDLEEYYSGGYGAVVSTTINKYVYVTVKEHGALFGKAYRLNYHESENVSTLDEVRNEIARECLRLVDVAPPLYISTVGDLPALSGLGGSSAFAVGLLKALHAMRGDRLSAAQLADEASHVEINVLKRPIGKQDHVAAAFGGFNYFRFNHDQSLNVIPLSSSLAVLSKLFGYFMLFWTGISRDSSTVLGEQKMNTQSRLAELDAMRDQAEELMLLLRQDADAVAFGRLLHKGWGLKRSLASGISSSDIDVWYDAAMAAGALGGKICGAGGGGFLLFIVPPSQQEAVRRALPTLKEVHFDMEPNGARLILSHLD